MANFLEALQAIKDRLDKSGADRDKIIEIINSEAKTNLKNKDIKIKNRVIFIQSTPIYKNAIFIKKKQILEKIKGELREKSPIDIR